jgi:hypothetical protein
LLLDITRLLTLHHHQADPSAGISKTIPFRHTHSVPETRTSSVLFRTGVPPQRRYAGFAELDREGPFMNGVWSLLGLAVFGLIAKMIGWSYVRARRSGLGFVSRRWLAEHNFLTNGGR